MRGIIAFFMILGMGGLAVHGCASTVGGGGGQVTERVIRAEPAQIVEAMNRSLSGDGMEVVSRSDSGDYYRLALTEAEMRSNPQFGRLADQGAVVFNAHVTQAKIEFTANFDSGLVSGFTIDMTRTSDGSGTLARVSPVIRNNGQAPNEAMMAALSRNFGRYGERTLETIANAAESDRSQPVL